MEKDDLAELYKSYLFSKLISFSRWPGSISLIEVIDLFNLPCVKGLKTINLSSDTASRDSLSLCYKLSSFFTLK